MEIGSLFEESIDYHQKLQKRRSRTFTWKSKSIRFEEELGFRLLPLFDFDGRSPYCSSMTTRIYIIIFFFFFPFLIDGFEFVRSQDSDFSRIAEGIFVGCALTDNCLSYACFLIVFLESLDVPHVFLSHSEK